MLNDNPAERLLNILVQGKKIDRSLPCRQAWGTIFQIDGNESDELFFRLAKVMALSRETVLLLAGNFPRQIEPAKQWRRKVEAAFGNQNLAAQWSTFIDHIDEPTLNLLTVTADLLGSSIGAKLIPDADLEKIQDSLKTLLTDIYEANLSTNLKSYLERELFDLLQHTRDYRVSGVLPILKQTESMVGHVLVDKEYKAFLTDHDLGKRLLDNINAAAALLTVALQLPQLGQAVALALK
jgi:hypothetical protein